MILRKFEQTR